MRLNENRCAHLLWISSLPSADDLPIVAEKEATKPTASRRPGVKERPD
jgi:hypothetical protein